MEKNFRKATCQMKISTVVRAQQQQKPRESMWETLIINGTAAGKISDPAGIFLVTPSPIKK